MKICHVTSAHRRYDPRIFLKQCTSLAKKYDVTLLCCDSLDDEIRDNVRIVSTHKKFKNRYDRIINAKRLLYEKCLEINADLYEFHDPDLLELADKIKKRNKTVIFDSHEDYPALFLEREWIPKVFRKILCKKYSNYENRVFKKLDYIFCVSPYMKKRIKLVNHNVEVIPNFPLFNKDFEDKKVNEKRFNLCFAGGIREDWNHSVIVRAIKDIDKVNYLIAGDCDTDYRERLKNLDVNNKTIFLGRLTHDEVNQLYSESYIGMALCSYRPNTNYKEGTLGNTKIFEYMESQLPVIVTDFSIYKQINEEKKFAICVNPNDVNAVKNAIEYLIKNPKEAQKMGKNGRYLIEKKYNWSETEKDLFKVYSILEKKSN